MFLKQPRFHLLPSSRQPAINLATKDTVYIFIFVSVSLSIYVYTYMVFTTEGLFEIAIESWPEWNLNPQPLNSVQTL